MLKEQTYCSTTQRSKPGTAVRHQCVQHTPINTHRKKVAWQYSKILVSLFSPTQQHYTHLNSFFQLSTACCTHLIISFDHLLYNPHNRMQKRICGQKISSVWGCNWIQCFSKCHNFQVFLFFLRFLSPWVQRRQSKIFLISGVFLHFNDSN